MWLAKQQKRERVEEPGGVGEVTLGGELPAVELESERRDLPVYAPGGYRWRPVQGQKVLVLKAGGEPCIVGAVSGSAEPGEVTLESTGGASVRLDNQGRVTLGGDTDIEGNLYIGGQELSEIVRSIVIEILASMMM